MTNLIQPAVKVTIAGEEYLLRFDFEAIAKAEELTNRALLTGLRMKDVDAPRINLVRAMLYACMLAEQPEMAYEMVRTLVTRRNLVELWEAVLEAWREGMVEAEDDEADTENPPRDQS